MTILAIETSCDETAVAIVKFGRKGKIKKIYANLVASQIKIHAPYGGVVPNLASREHERNLPLLLRQAQINKLIKKINFIAVTNGPGLSPCLWRGTNTARALARYYDKKLIAVNHLAGHIYSNWPFKFPALALIVSGGHTELVLMPEHLKYHLLGETRDDAAGEAFDKVARLLELGYPGGPLIEKLAREGNPKKYDLPRPMKYEANYDFSFSGLKTAVRYLMEKEKINKADLAASFQEAVIDVLRYKLNRAQEEFEIRNVVMGGGVTANQALRQALPQVKSPEPKLSLDNAQMIALAAYWKAKKGKFIKPENLEAVPNLMLN